MERIESIDVFKVLAIIAVISIHTSPFRSDLNGLDEPWTLFTYLDIFINQIARFAVPFFFVISGYFFAKKINSGVAPFDACMGMSKRILMVFIFWCFIYIMPYNINAFLEHGLIGAMKQSYWYFSNLLHDPFFFLMEGSARHLWFLMGLLSALFISTIFLIKEKLSSLIIFSIALYIFGVFAKAYLDSPLGIHLDFNTRNGPFFSTLLFVSGIYLSRKKVNTNWLYYGLLIAFSGTLLHFYEIYFLWDFYGSSIKQDYVFGTYFMGLGVAIISLSNHSKLRVKYLNKVGPLVLGVYSVHLIFVDILKPIDNILNSVIWELGFVFVVFILSIFVTTLLSRNSILKKFVI